MMLLRDLLGILSCDLYLDVGRPGLLVPNHLHPVVEFGYLFRAVEVLGCLIHLALLYLSEVHNIRI